MSEREFDAYLKLLGGLLRLAPGQREQIAVELRDHMEDRLEALLAAGVPREEAIGQALEEFGDVAALAASFRQIAWNRKRRWIMRYTAASVLGTLVIILAAAAFWPGDNAGRGLLSNAQAQRNGEVQTADPNSPDARNAVTRELLSQMTQAGYVDTPLDTFFADVSDRLGVDFYIDKAELEMNGVDADVQTVTLQMRDVRGSMLLDIVLSPLDCGYYLRDGFVCITSYDKAMSMAELRVYDCQAILDAVSVATPKNSRSASGSSGGGVGSLAADSGDSTFVTTHSNAGLLIEIITQTVDPDSWEVNGGWGSIAEYDGKLVVRQTDAAHAQIQYLLDNLGTESQANLLQPIYPSSGN